MTIKCPRCGRRQDVDPAKDRPLIMPQHENYTKTASCPAGGGRYFLCGDGDVVPAVIVQREGGHGTVARDVAILGLLGLGLQRRRARR